MAGAGEKSAWKIDSFRHGGFRLAEHAFFANHRFQLPPPHQSFVLYIVARGDRKYTIKVCRPLFVAPTRLRNRAGCAPDTNVWDPRNPRFEIGDLSRNFRKKRDQIQLIPILPEIEYLKIPCFQSLLPFLKGNLVVKILGCNVAGRDEILSRKAIMRDHELNR